MARIQPADALVAVDIGNTRIGFGVSDEDGLHDVMHAAADAPDAWREPLVRLWESCAGLRREIVIGSVVPQKTLAMAELARDACGVDPLIVREDLPLPMELEIDNPLEVGVDRICSAAAAYDHIRGACAVASLGTATTVDCVSAEGKFLGGAILPGFDMCFAALHERTAQLPRVTFEGPKHAFGRNTQEAILNGVAYGMVGALREIVERFAIELQEWPQLVITGGNAAVVGELADFVDSVVPNLCLMGVALTHRRAAGKK